MKKTLSIILFAILVICLAVGTIGCDDKNEPEKSPYAADITVFSDIHILASEQYGDTITPGLNRILRSNEKTIGLTEAIFKTAIDDFIASDSPILLITGDLTDDGAKVAHESVARELARAEAAGKRCYVVNGNHDINNHATSYVNQTPEEIDNVSPELFSQIYADFGFTEALTRDDNSLSYTAELNEKYRLIAWDIAKYDVEPGTERSVSGRHDPHVTDEGLDWLETQLQSCIDDGKKPFLITHFPILSHVGPLMGSASHVNRQADVLNVLDYYTQNDAFLFSFCGHVHQQDIATYSYGNKKYYEIETGALSFTTLPKRRFIDIGTDGAQQIEITTSQQSYVKAEYVPAFYPEEEKARFLADLPAYVWQYTTESFAIYMYGKLYMDDICALLGKTDDASIEAAQQVVDGFYYMPLYEKDANGGKSLEGICKKYGVNDLPVLTDGKTVGQFLASLVKSNFAGDENFTYTSDQAKVFTYMVYAAADQLVDTDILDTIGLLTKKTDGSDVRNISGLFASGKVEIVQSGVLEAIFQIPVIKNSVAARYDKDDPVETAKELKKLLDQSDAIPKLLPDGTLKTFVSDVCKDGYIEKIIDFSEVAETGKGYLNIDGIVELLFKKVGEGLIYDNGATDNRFSFGVTD